MPASNLSPMSQKLVRLTAPTVRQAAERIKSHEFFGLVPAAVNVEQLLAGFDIARAQVNGLQNSPIDGNQVSGETELGLIQTGDHQDLGHVAVIEHRIDRKIPGDFAEAGAEASLAPGAAHARLGVADDSRGAIDRSSGDQRLDGEIGGGGIATGIRDQARAANPLPAEFGKPVDGFGKKAGRGVLFFVPALVGSGVVQSESPAEIDDFCAGVEHGGRKFHGNSGRSGEEDHVQAFGSNSVPSAGNAAMLRMVQRLGAPAGILAMFQKDGVSMGVGVKEADQFGTAIAGEAGDADLIFIHRLE